MTLDPSDKIDAVTPAPNAPHLLVVNQHGDNRGDEAAMQGMISALRQRLPGVEFTILHQYAADESKIEIEGVNYLPLRVTIAEAFRLSAWAALAFTGVRLAWIPGPVGQEILETYDRTDAVISAPGGPYFGDLYANHEIVHWFYTWMAKLHDKSLVLYQPSSGPFSNKILNPIRRRGFRWFSQLTVRESISADNIETFTGNRPEIGSDSALHRRVEAAADVEPGLVCATFRDPGDDRKAAHDAAVVSAMVRVHAAGRRMLLLPQLHGPRHRDQPYLAELARRANEQGAAVEVAPETLSADQQRALVAASDFVLAGRYHPLVFAVSARIPALVIPYEHKARGVAEAAGLEQFIIELDDLDADTILASLDRLTVNLDRLGETVRAQAGTLEGLADATADRTAELVNTLRRPPT